MPGFDVTVGIRKAIRFCKDSELTAMRVQVLDMTARRYQKVARELSDRKVGYKKTWHPTGRLKQAIRISDFEPSKTGRTVALRVYVDREIAKDRQGTFYGEFQEWGTGIHSEKPGDPGQMIKPKNKKGMSWFQHGEPYTSKGRIFAKWGGATWQPKLKRPAGERLARKNRAPFIKGMSPQPRSFWSQRKSDTGVWRQIALEIKGVKPKAFMRGAAKAGFIKEAHDFARKWVKDNLLKLEY